MGRIRTLRTAVREGSVTLSAKAVVKILGATIAALFVFMVAIISIATTLQIQNRNSCLGASFSRVEQLNIDWQLYQSKVPRNSSDKVKQDMIDLARTRVDRSNANQLPPTLAGYARARDFRCPVVSVGAFLSF